MTTNESRLAEPNSAHIGEGVTFKGSISAPDVIVVDGIVEGDVTARSVRVGVSGSIKGTVTSIDADVHGKLCDKIEVKEFLLVRATGHIEGSLACGDVQVERGAILSATVTSTRAKGEVPARPAPERPAVENASELGKTEPAKIKLAAAE
jgi:cytoskeletal protein CcmA (bactofilin family)